MLCAALLPTVFQTNNARLVCCKLVMKKVPVKIKRKVLVNTTRRFRSSAVLIMNKENHSIVRTLLSNRYQTGVTSAKEVVCSCLFVCCGWCRPSKPHHPKVSLGFLIKDNPQIADPKPVKAGSKYIYGKVLLSAPRSQIAVSSICD